MIGPLLAVLLAAAPAGETTWAHVMVPGEGEILDWYATAADEVWVLREGRLLHLRGDAWTEVPLPADLASQAKAILVTDEGAERVLWVFDGPRVWRQYRGHWQNWPLEQRAMSLWDFHSPERGCVSALWYRIECFDGQQWSIVDDPAVAEWEITYPTKLFVTSTHVIGINTGGTAYVHDGRSWSRWPVPVESAQECGGARIGEQVFLSCQNEYNYRWTDDGWEPVSDEMAATLEVPVRGYHYNVLGGELVNLRGESPGEVLCPYRLYPSSPVFFFADGGVWIRAKGGDLMRRVEERLPQPVPWTIEAGLAGLLEVDDVASWDINADGADDLLVVSGTKPDRLYLSSGGTYHDRTDLLGDESGCCASDTESVTPVDLDGDRRRELVFARSRGTDQGTQRERTVYRSWVGGGWRDLAGTKMESWPADSALYSHRCRETYTDLDGDSDLDMYLPRYFGPGEYGALNVAYLNDGHGRFTMQTYSDHRRGGGNLGFSESAVAANLDDRPGEEILLLSYFGRGDKLYTWTDGELHDVTRESGIAAGFSQSVAAEFGDLDGDGDLDLVVIHDTHLRLYRNDGDLRFVDVTMAWLGRVDLPGPGRAVALADLEGDGDPDLVIAHEEGSDLDPSGSRVYLNQGDGTFRNATHLVLGKQEKDFGNVLVLDAHGDGDPDLFFFGAEGSQLLDNRTPGTAWVKIELACRGQNTGCVGAVITAREGARFVHASPVRPGRGTVAVPVPGGQSVDLELHLADGRVMTREGVPPGVVRLGDGWGPGGAWDRVHRSLVRRYIWGPPWVQFAKLAAVFGLVLLALVVLRSRVPKAALRLVPIAPGVVAIATVADVHAAWTPRAIDLGLGPAVALVLLASVVSVEIGVATYRRNRYVAHFKLLGFLGEGGMGKVYKALDLSDGKTVALKLVKPDVLQSDHGRQRFLREAELCWSASHRGVVQIYEKGECEVYYEGTRKTVVYLSMEFVPGLTLGQLAGLNPRKLPLQRVLAIGAEAAEVLGEVHGTGVIHRDIKPSNIMVVGDHDVKLMDFGIAKAESMTSMTETGMLMGTVRYMAPEQFLGRDATTASDLYALGLVVYELLAGRHPFPDDVPLPTLVYHVVKTAPPPPSQFNPALPPVVDAAVLRALEREPGERYTDGAEMAAALRFVLKDLSSMQRSTPCGLRLSEEPAPGAGVTDRPDPS